MRKIAVAVVLAMVFSSPALAQQRRAATPAAVDESTVAGWLRVHARPLVSVQPHPWSYDLDPLGRMVGDATIVALGDATHGTHEFYKVKQRLIDYLAREKNFDIVAFEGPFSIFQQLDDWVRGGAGDPVEILGEAEKLGYYFWYTEEMVELVRAMREYNLRRGSDRSIGVAGLDIFGYPGNAAAVVTYLRSVDPAAAAQAEELYGCLARPNPSGCKDDVGRVHDQLAARRSALAPLSSPRAFDYALRAAFVVVQYVESGMHGRDASMAANALWLQQQQSRSGKIILWAHNEHVGETRTANAPHPMGLQIAGALAEPNHYFAIGTLAGSGSFLQYTQQTAAAPSMLVEAPFRTASADSYEARFSEPRAAALLVPLEGSLPSWLTTGSSFRWAGSGPVAGQADVVQKEALPEKFDAVVFIATTTPARMLRR